MKLAALFEVFDEVPEDLSDMSWNDRYEYYWEQRTAYRSMHLRLVHRIFRTPEYSDHQIFDLDDYNNLFQQDPNRYINQTTPTVFCLGGYKLLGLKTNKKVNKWLDQLAMTKEKYREYDKLIRDMEIAVAKDNQDDNE